MSMVYSFHQNFKGWIWALASIRITATRHPSKGDPPLDLWPLTKKRPHVWRQSMEGAFTHIFSQSEVQGIWVKVYACTLVSGVGSLLGEGLVLPSLS